MIRLLVAALVASLASPVTPASDDLLERVEHGSFDSGGVELHYAALGEGPLVVMLHGFPDYWYTWRAQMDALSDDHFVVALDLRGYNRSEAPAGVEAYAMPVLLADVDALIGHLGREKAIVVGHDWGGAIAWQFAMHYPARVEKLAVLNLPHPAAFARELAKPAQQAASGYARRFQEEGAHEQLSAQGLAAWVRDDEARVHYVEAFERSSFEAMLSYYKANFPRPGADAAVASSAAHPRIAVPVLQIHGMDDAALLPGGLDGTWQWLDADWTLVTIPGAGHFVQYDAADLVTRSLAAWLRR